MCVSLNSRLDSNKGKEEGWRSRRKRHAPSGQCLNIDKVRSVQYGVRETLKCVEVSSSSGTHRWFTCHHFENSIFFLTTLDEIHPVSRCSGNSEASTFVFLALLGFGWCRLYICHRRLVPLDRALALETLEHLQDRPACTHELLDDQVGLCVVFGPRIGFTRGRSTKTPWHRGDEPRLRGVFLVVATQSVPDFVLVHTSSGGRGRIGEPGIASEKEPRSLMALPAASSTMAQRRFPTASTSAAADMRFRMCAGVTLALSGCVCLSKSYQVVPAPVCTPSEPGH